jgi:voltage-gated potassium channel
MTEGNQRPAGSTGPADLISPGRTAKGPASGGTSSSAIHPAAQEKTAPTGDPHLRGAAYRSRNLIMALSLLRALATIVVLVVVYYLVPVDHPSDAKAVVAIVAGIVGVALVVWWQVRTIVKADHPGLKALEVLAVIAPLFLLLFAMAYYLIERATPASFGQSLSRTDALYFTVTTFTTVGYGDIAAKTQAARIMVTFQMLADLIILGVAVKVIIQAAQQGRQRRPVAQADGSLDSTSTLSSGAPTPGLATSDTGSPAPRTQPP